MSVAACLICSNLALVLSNKLLYSCCEERLLIKLFFIFPLSIVLLNKSCALFVGLLLTFAFCCVSTLTGVEFNSDN